MDRIYQVFVSSTYEDLQNERQEVMRALLELNCMPAGMELFPAANEDQWTLIKRVIDICDYYLIIVGGRYGSLNISGLSYTEMEYKYAQEKGKPIIAFLHKEPSSLPSLKIENTDEGKARFINFRNLLQKRLCKFWTSPSDLASVVSRSIIHLIKEHPANGWIRYDLTKERSFSNKILQLKKQVNQLESSRQILKRRVDIPRETWMNLLKNANQSFDSFAMASMHYVEHPDFFSTLDTRITNSLCKYRFFLLDPDCEYALQREMEEMNVVLPLRQRIQQSLDMLTDWLNRPGKTLRHSRFELYLYKSYPIFSLVRSDETMFISSYLFYDNGDYAPTLCIRENENKFAFETYIENINKLNLTGAARIIK